MKRDDKKALYENIMTSVAREVKKTLNESNLDKSVFLINKIKEMSGKLYQNGIKHVDFNGELLVRPNDCIFRHDEEPLKKPLHILYLNTY